jgi:hypothetical protein
MPSPSELEIQAQRLLILAERAREQGELFTAEMLTERARELHAQAVKLPRIQKGTIRPG